MTIDQAIRHAPRSKRGAAALIALITGFVSTAACGGKAEVRGERGGAGTPSSTDGGATDTPGAAGRSVGGEDSGVGGSLETGGSPDGSGGTALAAGEGGETSRPVKTPWRMSSTPFCGTPGVELNEGALWSDSRGVYLLEASAPGRARLEFNAGDGWQTLLASHSSPNLAALTGIWRGPLIEYGSSACAIAFIDGKQMTCSAASSQVSSVFMVDDQLGYAVYGDRLLRYDGTLWTQDGPKLEPANQGQAIARAVWASTDTVVIAANAGRIYLGTGPQMDLQADVPDGDYAAAWGFAPDDLWVGNDAGQLVHFDGEHWKVGATLPGDCGAIRSLWGSDGVLFYATNHSFGYLEHGRPKALADYGCDSTITVKGMWGNSNREVFFATQDYQMLDAPCARIELSWFDGSALNPL